MKMVIESAEEIFDLDLDTIGYFFGELVDADDRGVFLRKHGNTGWRSV